MNKINWQEKLNQMLFSDGKRKSYFTTGVTILFIVIMSIVGLLPSISSLSSQLEDNTKRDTIITSLEKKLDDLKSLTLEKDSIQGTVEYFNTIIPNHEDQENTINLLNVMADKHNVFISNFLFDRDNRELQDKITTTYGENIKAMYLSISLDGDRQGISGFLADVESSAKILNISDLVLNRVKVLNDLGIVTGTTYNVNLKFIIYYYKPV